MKNDVRGANSAPPSQVRGRNKGRTLLPGDAEVEQIVTRINAKLQSETVEFIMEVGRDLVELFGCGTGKNRVPGLLRLSKAEYPKVGLRCGYSWTRQVIKIATSPNLANPAKWPLLPPTRSALYQCSLMSPSRFAEGMAPDATGETTIHPHSLRQDLKVYRKRSEPITQPSRAVARTVILIYLPRTNADGGEYGFDGAINMFREQAFDAGAGFGIGEQVSRRLVLRMDTDPDVSVTTVTIKQYGDTERFDDRTTAKTTAAGFAAGAEKCSGLHFRPHEYQICGAPGDDRQVPAG